jgi:hypothetical protein
MLVDEFETLNAKQRRNVALIEYQCAAEDPCRLLRPREMLGRDPQGAQRLQEPLPSNTTGCPLSPNVDIGGGAVVGEQVGALILRGDVGVGQRLQPGAQDGLAQVLGIAELGMALVGGLPVLGQQADHRLAAGVGLLQRLPPPLPGPDSGVRI